MYKDKLKQREKTAERVRRYRDKQKGVTSLKGVTKEGGTTEIIVSIEKAAKLKMICDSFLVKPSGKYLMSLCWYGGLRLDQIAKQLL